MATPIRKQSDTGLTTPKRRSGKIAPKSIGKLKRELDATFSKYVRTKHSRGGICHCYTCNRPMEIKKAQCGHFVPRIYLATRWDELNCRPQCAGCNIWGRGQLLDFEENLIKEIGKEKVEALKKKRNEIWKLNREWYEKKVATYQQLLNQLAANP